MSHNPTSTLKNPPLSDPPALLRAVNMTLAALEDRGRYFRNLVVSVVFAGGSSVLGALVLHRWTALSGFILLIPAVGTFLIVDSQRTQQWRKEVLHLPWNQAGDYSLFKSALLGYTHLPKRSLLVMINTLPPEENYGEEVVQTLQTASRRYKLKVLLSTLLLTLAFSVLVAATSFHSVILMIASLFFAAGVIVLKSI